MTLHKPEPTVTVKVFKPLATGVNVAGLLDCPLLHAKLLPLVVSVIDVEANPQTVGTFVPATVGTALMVTGITNADKALQPVRVFCGVTIYE